MPLSALGQERPFCHLSNESGLPPTPDILRHRSEPPLRARRRPEQVQQHSVQKLGLLEGALLDNLIGDGKEAGRNGETEYFSCPQVDHEAKLRRL
jgi:hypothetical protein